MSRCAVPDHCDPPTKAVPDLLDHHGSWYRARMGSGVPLVAEPAEGETNSTRDRRLAAALVLSGVAAVAVVGVLVVGRQLRPLADDYCLAMWAGDGLFGGMQTILRTWSGDAVIAFSNVLFVGLPLIILPWSVASVLPFLLGALSVAVAACVVLSALGAFRVRARTGFLLLPILMLTWWSYWWIPVRHSDPVPAVVGGWDLELAGSVTFWQNINSAYIIPTSAWAVVCALLWKRVDRPLGPTVVLWAALGLAMGLSGPVLALSFVAVIVVLIAVRLLRGDLRKPAVIRFGLLAAGTLAGVAASLTSPGNRSRTAFLTDTPYSTMNGPMDLLVWTVEGASRAWWGMLVGWSTLFVLLVSGLLAVLLGAGGRVVGRRVVLAGAALLTLSLCLHGASVAAEAFSYAGFWHVIVPTLVMFWALVCLGWGFGCLVAGRAGASRALAIAGGLALGVAATVAVADMSGAISQRYDTWTRGPAPFGRISDTEAEYVVKCQQKLAEHRDLPDRGRGNL